MPDKIIINPDFGFTSSDAVYIEDLIFTTVDHNGKVLSNVKTDFRNRKQRRYEKKQLRNNK